MKTMINLCLCATFLVGIASCTNIEPSVLNFNETLASGLESQGVYTVTISLDKSVSADVDLSYTLSGTAEQYVDYDLPSSIRIPAGSTSTSFDLTLYDNYVYSAEDKTVIIDVNGLTGSDNVNFGSTKFTFTIMENDVEIALGWTVNGGNAADYDLDLYVYRSDDLSSFYKSSSSFTDNPEVIVLGQDEINETYYAVAKFYSGDVTSATVNYTMTIKYPDGTTSSNADVYNANKTSPRSLFEVVKSGDGDFTATADPFGPDGIQIGEPVAAK